MEEIERTANIILGNKESIFDRIYYHSNENLDLLFSGDNVSSKNVLTVLASGDQLFHLYQKNALSVDTFDINPLTKYYYYLRKWSILYFNQYYPDVFSNEFIYKLLSRVLPDSEEEEYAYKYWFNYIQRFCGFMTRDLFQIGYTRDMNTISDLSVVKERLRNEPFHFTSFDISKDLPLMKKYDCVVTSNISEYFSNDRERLEIFKNNVVELLNDDGVLLCSYVMNHSYGRTFLEKITFQDEFDCYHIMEDGRVIGDAYKKKVLTKNS